MEDQVKQPWGEYPPPGQKSQQAYPTGKKELIFAALILLCAMALCNFILFGGFNLGFAIAAGACVICSSGYLLASGCRLTAYSGALLALSVVIVAGFARSGDGFVKFIMACFLLVSVNLGLTLTAGKNLHHPGGVSSLLDAPRTVFALGFGKLPEAFSGLIQAFRRTGTAGQKGGAVLVGLCIAVPLLAVVIPLLISADAAFDGLIALLPEFDLGELVSTVVLGTMLASLLYTRGAALRHSAKGAAKASAFQGISAITVNTVLGAVCAVYFVYLLSQLAYLAGGFSGILPESYTMAEYARRGFFEMALLCGVNLSVIALCLGLVRKEAAAPVSTKMLCLFIGLVTLFLVATASAKMFLYIGSYGLTRLRVLTQVIMLFMALTVVFVMIWLFVPKLPYMKAVLLLGLVIGGAVLWADVDTQVARYNVDAYLSGQLETVDISYLVNLGDGAIPQLDRLAQQAQDAKVADAAQRWLDLKLKSLNTAEDFRGWNYTNHAARQYLPDEDTQAAQE